MEARIEVEGREHVHRTIGVSRLRWRSLACSMSRRWLVAWKRMEAREADDALLSSDLPAAIHTILTAPRIAEFWLIVCLPIRGVRRPAAGTLAPNAAGA